MMSGLGLGLYDLCFLVQARLRGVEFLANAGRGPLNSSKKASFQMHPTRGRQIFCN